MRNYYGLSGLSGLSFNNFSTDTGTTSSETLSASFFLTNTEICNTESITLAFNGSGTPTDYLWILGLDTVTDAGPTVTHNFGTVSGTHTLSLICWDNTATDTYSQEVQLVAPLSGVSFEFNPEVEINSTLTYAATYTGEGIISWVYGQGMDIMTVTDYTITYVPTTTEYLYLLLTAENCCGSETAVQYIVVLSTLSADCDFTETTGCIGTTYTLNPVGSGTPTALEWTIAGPQNTDTYTYSPLELAFAESPIEITLQVSDEYATDTWSHTITLFEQPEANIDGLATLSCGQTGTYINNSMVSATLSWSTDGTATEDSGNLLVYWAEAGTHVITLTAETGCTYTEGYHTVTVLGLDYPVFSATPHVDTIDLYWEQTYTEGYLGFQLDTDYEFTNPQDKFVDETTFQPEIYVNLSNTTTYYLRAKRWVDVCESDWTPVQTVTTLEM